WVKQQSLQSSRSSLQTVVAEKSFHGAARVSQLGADAAGKFKLQKSVRGALQIRSVTVPPWLFASRQAVDINIFHLHHFEQPGFPMRATPAARATPAMRRFGNTEIADGVVHHDRARAEFRCQRHSSSFVLGPNTRCQGERRIIGVRNRLLGITENLNGEDWPEGFLLK